VRGARSRSRLQGSARYSMTNLPHRVSTSNRQLVNRTSSRPAVLWSGKKLDDYRLFHGLPSSPSTLSLPFQQLHHAIKSSWTLSSPSCTSLKPRHQLFPMLSHTSITVPALLSWCQLVLNSYGILPQSPEYVRAAREASSSRHHP